jgi:hypothetical protein
VPDTLPIHSASFGQGTVVTLSSMMLFGSRRPLLVLEVESAVAESRWDR